MNGYGFLAASYDTLTSDVNYTRWADYIEKHFSRAGRPVRTVLDLACGTGTLACLLARRGYDMTGADISPDMLAQAADKVAELSDNPPLLLCQSMDKLDLNDTVDACICCLDSVNHVTRPALLRRAFERVFLFLSPGGLFLFDISTPERLRGLDGGLFLDESEDVYCVWRSSYSPRRRVCTFGMDVFRREGEHWLRGSEYFEEYAYTPEKLRQYLSDAGFTRIRTHGELKMRSPRPGEGRIFFSAHKV